MLEEVEENIEMLKGRNPCADQTSMCFLWLIISEKKLIKRERNMQFLLIKYVLFEEAKAFIS